MKHSFLFILAFILSLTVSSQTIYYVSKNGNDNNNGRSWATAKKEIQTAIDAAQENDQVWIAEGTYYPTKYIKIGDPRYKSFIIKKGVSIYGSFNGTEKSINERKPITETTSKTILSGDNDGVEDVWTFDNEKREWIVTGNDNNSLHVVYNFKNMLFGQVIDGFEICGGNAKGIYSNEEDAYGGGVYAKGHMEFVNCIVTKNVASYGGGIYTDANGGETSTIKNCFIIQNASTVHGGGIRTKDYGAIRNSTIESNSSKMAGGVYAINQSSIYESLIQNNYATEYAGGIYLEHSNVYDSEIDNNFSSGNGGGIYAIGDYKISNNNISSNWAKGDGGGIYAESHVAPIKGCNIFNNTAENNGGGINVQFGVVSKSKIYNNKAYNSGGGINVENYKTTWFNLTVTENSINNNIAQDGGGIGSKGAVTINRCHIFSNIAESSGGGINSSYANIYNSQIVNNSAKNTGGILSTGEITNSLIANNYANNYAAISMATQDKLNVNLSTIVNNESDDNILCNNITKLDNTIIWNNKGELLLDSPSNINNSALQQSEFINSTNILLEHDNTGDINNKNYPYFKLPVEFIGNSKNEAQLAEINNANWSITENSACRNAGNKDINMSNILSDILLDIYGNIRIEEDIIDIGATEYQATTGVKLPVVETFDECSNGIVNESYFFRSHEGWNVEKYLGEGSLAASFSYKANVSNRYKVDIYSVKINTSDCKEIKISYDLQLIPNINTYDNQLHVKILRDGSWETLYSHYGREEIPLQTFTNTQTLSTDDKYIYIKFNCAGYKISEIIYWYLDNIKIEKIGGSSIEEDIEDKSLIKVYPNPTKDIIKIDCEDALNVQIYSISGTKVMESSDKEISIGHLASGIYTVIIGTPDRRQVTKIIKTN